MKTPDAYRPPHDLKKIVEANAFLRELGVVFRRLDGDGAVFELDLDNRHLNAEGRPHGGVYTTILDAASGFATRFRGADTPLSGTLTLSLTTEFMGVPETKRLVATGVVVGGGQSIAFTRAKLHDSGGALIASASGTFKRVFPKRDSEHSGAER
ncbi:PaaI family thioesterase [Notoacmeibacter sp. MSK16QG-6]|uniref:PaaI family thioesterase n=1 Tax=Notoacmeibacter sp. MSK16QG-6 TaxID=2957982 RepID=UPI00209D06B9|nr:PaaI family thioesterase [Notoacmeibacter sp. MSK16QG-6]MCP1198349.1 PaaI family thioesterase [Notoacmeibacter sp. MSK16QG-6]